MSGGHYDYIQYRMEELADKIRRDWLLSDDDGEDSFMRRWEQELPET